MFLIIDIDKLILDINYTFVVFITKNLSLYDVYL
jgi:hypothetical protein